MAKGGRATREVRRRLRRMDAHEKRELVVLEVVPRLGPNPYLRLLAESLERESVIPRLFTWWTAFFAKYDVVHLHWPDFLLRARTPVRGRLRSALVRLLLLRWRLTKTPLVRTTHNQRPHDALPQFQWGTLAAIDRQTAHWIKLAKANPTPPGATTTLIRHGHYRDIATGVAPREPIEGRIALFGALRAYKGIDELLRAFKDTAEPILSLKVAGKPQDAATERGIRLASHGDGRILLDLRFLPDDELLQEIRDAELVVLPYGGENNSGAAILALSFDCPVLVPRSELAEELAEEVDAGWVFVYDGPLTGDILAAAWREARETRGHPDLSQRDWRTGGRLHRVAFTEAIKGVH